MRKTFTSTLLLISVVSLSWSQPSLLQEAAQYQNKAASQLLSGDLEGAITHLEKAASLYESAQEWEFYFSCLNQATNAYLSTGRVEDAKRTAKKALWDSIQRLGRDNDEAAKAAHRLAEVYSRAGRHKKAMDVHEMGLMIRESIYGDGHIKLADSYDWVARAWAAAGDFEQAANFYERAMGLRKALLGPQHPDIAISYNNLAGLEMERSNYRQALTHYQTAYNISRNRLGEMHPQVALALASMARVNRLMGKWEQAVRQYKDAALLFQQIPDAKGALAAEAFHERANQLFNEGKLAAAGSHAQRAIQALAFDSGQARFGEYHQSLGAILMEMGRYEEAAGSFKQGLATKKGATAAIYQQWSESLRLSGNLPAALSAANEFMEWAEKYGGAYALLNARAQLGRLLIDNEQAEAGTRQLTRVLNHAQTPYWLAREARFSLAGGYLKNGAQEQAIEQYKQLATEAQHHPAGALFFHFKALLALGSTHIELAYQDRNTLYNLEAALNTFRACDDMLSGLSRSPLPSEQIHFLLEAHKQLYDKAIGACYHLYQQNQEDSYLEEAFYFTERSKQVRMQLPLLLLSPESFAQVPQALLEKESEHRMAVQALYRALKKSRFQEVAVDSIETETGKREEAYQALLAELEEEAPEYFGVKFGGGDIVGQEELNAILQERLSVLYSYYIDEEGLYVFHFSGERMELFRWPLDEALRTNLLSFVQMAANKPEETANVNGGAEYRRITALAVQLYEKLLPGLSAHEGAPVILLPHGPMQWFPFEALLPSAPAEGDFTSLPYLGLNHSLYYYSSATALWKASGDSPSFSYQSPFEAMVLSAAGSQVALKENYGGRKEESLDLRYFLEPARTLAAREDGRLWEGAMAREEVFRQLSPSEVLLMAIHIQAGVSPEETFLSFAGKSDSLHDNRLYLKEIYGLHKPVGLYVLASAKPQSFQQSGWQQLAEALCYSGGQSILFHRWPATGEPSAELLQLFLASRKAAGNGPGGLQEARRQYLAQQAGSPERAHPHFWAGYSYYGLPENARIPASIPPLWIIASVAGLIFIGWLVRLH